MDRFYLDNGLKDTFGYMRTIVARFEKGSAHQDPAHDGKSYVKALVQYQFRPGAPRDPSNLDCAADSTGCFQVYHKGLMEGVQGKLNPDSGGVAQLELSSNAWAAPEQSKIKGKIQISPST